MTNKEYKALSIKEFTKAAEGYEGDKAGIYEMYRKDYTDILAELEKLLPGFRSVREISLVEGMKVFAPVYNLIGRIGFIRNLSM